MTPEPFTVDELARKAAASINEAVETADLQLFAAGIPALRPTQAPASRFGTPRWVTVAGSFAAILIIVGLAVLPGRLFTPEEVASPDPTVAESVDETLVSNPEESDGEVTPATVAPQEDPTTTVPDVSTTTIVVDTTPPEISITSPTEGATVTEGTIQFRGVTEPDASVVAAGQWEADVDDEGNWEIILGLNSGSNIATFTAIDTAGNEATVQISVFYDPPSPTTTVPEEVEFSANAQFETCEETPAFNVYWGSAPAGSKVIVSSEFGSGFVHASENGEWELRVEFPEAPFGDEFLVTVSNAESGGSKGFVFTSFAG